MERNAAVVDAGQKRARPIIMTTLAMVAGMMPSALSFGAGGEFRSPMALAVIGGLVFSTALSLVFVPAMFAPDGRRLAGVLAAWTTLHRLPRRRGHRAWPPRRAGRPALADGTQAVGPLKSNR